LARVLYRIEIEEISLAEFNPVEKFFQVCALSRREIVDTTNFVALRQNRPR
jgi:hypothetical protein